MMQNRNAVLLVTNQPDLLVDSIAGVLEKFEATLYTANSGIAGISAYKKYLPCLIVVDNNLSDMLGVSFSSLIKTSDCPDCVIYIYNIDKILLNTKADAFFNPSADIDVIVDQVKKYFELKQLRKLPEFERAKAIQQETIPDKLETDTYMVDKIFCPFNELSGDGLDYWTAQQDSNKLYGVIFDCTGHNLISYFQTSEIRSLLIKNTKFFMIGMYKSLSEVLEHINEDLFVVHGDETDPTAAIVFFIDFNEGVLHFCSAGIPSFLVRCKNQKKFQTITMKNYALGYEQKVKFDEQSMPLINVAELIFASDGFTEVLADEDNNGPTQKSTQPIMATHDDATAIIIKIKEKKL